MTHRHPLRLPAVTSLATAGLVTSLAAQVATTPAGAPYPPPRGPHPVAVERSVMVPMRDGVKLATDVYRPADLTGPLPAILMRTPYNKQGSGGAGNIFASNGYVVVVQDVRGKFGSEGEYKIYNGDMTDWSDAFDWIGAAAVEQPSASAASAAPTSASSRSSPRSSVTRCTSPRFHRPRAETSAASDGIARSGDRSRAARTRCRSTSDGCRCGRRSTRAKRPRPDGRHRDIPPDAAAHRHDGSRRVAVVGLAEFSRALARRSVVGQAGLSHRRRQRVRRRAARVVVVRHGRRGARGARDLREEWRRMRERATISTRSSRPRRTARRSARRARRKSGALDVGDARLHHWDMYLAWFDRWLRGNEHAIDSLPRIQYYTIGMNGWRKSDRWPVAGMRETPFYLRSDGGANTSKGNGRLSLTPPPAAEPARHLHV